MNQTDREVVSDSTASHAKFLDALRESQKAVRAVWAWLKSRDHNAVVGELSYAPTWAEWSKHSDSGDITIIAEKEDQRIEVKHIGRDFTSARDYPYPDLLVEAKGQYDRKHPEPYAYFIVNKSMTHAAIVLCAHRARWSVRSVRHPWLPKPHDCYVCPLTLASFVSIRVQGIQQFPVTIFADNEFGF